MKLNIEKVQKEVNRLGWSPSEFGRQIALKNNIKAGRQYAHWILNGSNPGRSFMVIERIAKTLDLDPKDLII